MGNVEVFEYNMEWLLNILKNLLSLLVNLNKARIIIQMKINNWGIKFVLIGRYYGFKIQYNFVNWGGWWRLITKVGDFNLALKNRPDSGKLEKRVQNQISTAREL
jgi:hypothetical protein